MKKLMAAGAVMIVAAAGVWADIASPREQWETVRMDSETVRVTLTASEVVVNATFVMTNTGEASEVVVGYPRGPLEAELEDFKASVDGKAIKDVADGPEKKAGSAGVKGGRRGPAYGGSYKFAGDYAGWKVFKVPFAEGQTRTVVVSYRTKPTPVKVKDQGDALFYSYIMRTGATWKGKIGEADIAIEIAPFAREILAVSPKPTEMVEARTDPPHTSVRWRMKDFEPDSNIEITIRVPRPAGT